MDNGNFEDIIRRKLENHKSGVPADGWQAIEKRLPGRRVSLYRSFLKYAAVGALLIGGVWAVFRWEPDYTPPVAESIVPEVPVPQAIPVLPDSDSISVTGQKEKTFMAQSQPVIAVSRNQIEPGVVPTSQIFSESTPSVSDLPFTEDVSGPEIIEQDDREAVVQKEFPAVSEDKQAEYEQMLRDFEQEGIKTEFPEKRSEKEKSAFSIGLMAYNAITSKSSLGSNQALNGSAPFRKPSGLTLLSAPVYTYTHQIPLSFGLTAGKNFGRHWGIETGVVYTYLRSEFKDNEMVTRGKQDLHYIGIPLGLSYRFGEWKNFSVYLSFGTRADFNVAARQIAEAGSGTETVNADMKLEDDRVQWSLQLKPGVTYAFTRWLNIYAEPGVAWYIDNGSDVKNIWKDKPVTFALQIGLKTSF